MATIETNVTPEELLAMPDGKSFELVDGHLVERTVNAFSSWLGGELFGFVRDFCRTHKTGLVWPADNGLQCFADQPNKVRRPDVSFVRKERLAGEWRTAGFLRIVPDLVAEVVSPHDLAYEVDAKVIEYLAAGVRLVWVVNPEARTVRVHRADGSAAWLGIHDSLDGEDVLPGFRLPLSELFADA